MSTQLGAFAGSSSDIPFVLLIQSGRQRHATSPPRTGDRPAESTPPPPPPPFVRPTDAKKFVCVRIDRRGGRAVPVASVISASPSEILCVCMLSLIHI